MWPPWWDLTMPRWFLLEVLPVPRLVVDGEVAAEQQQLTPHIGNRKSALKEKGYIFEMMGFPLSCEFLGVYLRSI